MAKVKVIVGSGVVKSLERRVAKRLRGPKVLADVNNAIQSALRANRYASLSSETIKRRKRLATTNSTDSNYSPARSNLTFTGELIRSITATFKGFSLRISPKGRHKGYKLINGGRSKSVSNQDIAEGQAAQGRDIITLTQDNIIKRIVKIFNKVLK